MRAVAAQAFTSATELDGRFLGSLKRLVMRPGQLTLDYLNGIRKHRLAPFQLLLLINIAFFLMAAYVGHSAFTTRLDFHTGATNFIHQPLAAALVDDRLRSSGETRASFAQRFNARVEVQAKSMVMLMVPLLALLVWLLFPAQANRWIRSLIFATHLFAFMLLVQTFIAPPLSALMNWAVQRFALPLDGGAFEVIYSLLLFALFGVYFFLAAQRVYGRHTALNLARVLAFLFATYWIYLIYRMVLFFTAFYSL